jgi:hypothetical protein
MNLKSVVAVAAITAAAKQLGIKITAKQLPILIAIQAGHFLTEIDVEGNAYVNDGIGAADGFVYQFLKTLTDDSVALDNAVTAFYKVLAENPSVSDTDVLHFYKSLSDASNATDTHFSNVGKALTDTPIAVDVYAYAAAKALTDDPNATDAYAYALARAFAETPGVTDINVLSPSKSLSEAPNFTDGITSLVLSYLFADIVTATDDIDGAASILDDQEMQFVKNTTDITSTTDALSRVVYFTRSFTETPNSTDSATLSYGSTFLETPSFTDAGSLRSQGYCDFTFFAEDFVGASRTF